jgi:1,4-dihydroxy-2-naphthoate octaprenyltransferase
MTQIHIPPSILIIIGIAIVIFLIRLGCKTADRERDEVLGRKATPIRIKPIIGSTLITTAIIVEFIYFTTLPMIVILCFVGLVVFVLLFIWLLWWLFKQIDMKLTKRWHLVKVGKTPLFQIRSEGYKRALIDLGIKETPKAKRDL